MSTQKDNSAQYLISTVTKRSGVKSDLVRAWERRYQAVSPTRTAGGHRVYTDLDIARLKLLNEATSSGHSIGQIANLSLDDLKKLLQHESSAPVSAYRSSTPPAAVTSERRFLAEDYIEKCYAAVLAFDAHALESHFENAIVELGPQLFIENLLTPLLTQIGERWRDGELRPVHEHMASSIIRSLTYILRNNTPCAANAPRMIVTTPIGQLHELGALLAAIIAEFKNWKVTYLGANLPSEEIAAAVKYTQANAVTLSISFSADDLVVPRELRKLRKLIGNDKALIVGGRSAGHYQAVLDEVGVLKIQNYDHFRLLLDELAAKHYAEQST
ncbi:MAG: MerR family transcriptional regulator [Methylococcaceae bacterium]|jgi:DNA-binding transcriptional MerR regulator/methylmalonyl-CoA mutase cobalamin-binding subunit|nr:MerR family transcriptional regulator [Methylococcaceae bacterium]MDZ4155797.1 MerR family transcriptional regulator [Methylococcales bacterium]MDP2391854.1 MerR family transcriptional regulator [Methylococcaceae bacterium]MDP3018907.1 MerR family transcriptional regulator [Methylococcaceae bacterium]MDP3391468.1 MerR family transcriptional regulator [Methylococcaceae bacterium]